LELAAAGALTSADRTNREYVGQDVKIDETVDPDLVKLLFDPQTAGGMLISVSSDAASSLLNTLRANYPFAQIIGRVTAKSSHSIVVLGVR
jgi:selenide,water dikinase